MKVSILSMQRIINYGSFLQAFALKTILESLGHDVNFIDIQPGEYKEINNDYTKKKLLNKVLKYLNFKIIKKIRFKKNSNELTDLLIQMQYKYLGLKKEIQKIDTNCEAVVIGSDEVFNCTPKASWGLSTQLLGNIDAPKVISYAASCGYTKYEDVPNICINSVINALNNLDSISVRDENTKIFVEKMIGKTPLLHLDPVLIYEFENEIKDLKMQLPDQYMIVYAYYNRINDKNEIKEITNYAKKNKMKMFCVGAEQEWCDEFPVWTPFEVLYAFKHATCIVTDTFHGTVMASKFNKKFATIIRNSNSNKLLDLMIKLNLTKHIVENINNFENVIEYEDDYSVFNNKIEYEKERTLTYLKSNL